MPVPFLKLVRLEGARLAAMLQAEPAHARNEAFERAFPGALGAACFGEPAQWASFAEAAPHLPLAPAHMARLVPASEPLHDSKPLHPRTSELSNQELCVVSTFTGRARD